MERSIHIGDWTLDANAPPFVVAEAGINHNGSLERALSLVDAASAAGADAVKFQLYRPEEQVSRVAAPAQYQRETTGATSMLEMGRAYDLPWEAHREIADHCKLRGVVYLSSAFEPAAVDFLLEIDAPAMKLASGEITNYPLLRRMAVTRLPVILSTGMSTLKDVCGAVECIRDVHPSPIILLHCVSAYPTPPECANLRAIETLRAAFRVPVGFSDHTEGTAAAAASVALGASVLEKHFTLDRSLPGPDHAMSLEPSDLAAYVEAVRATHAMLGDGVKRPQACELEVRTAARRSLVSKRLIRAGEPLSGGNVAMKRPATGIDPRLWEAVRGRVARTEIGADIPITFEMLL